MGEGAGSLLALRATRPSPQSAPFALAADGPSADGDVPPHPRSRDGPRGRDVFAFFFACGDRPTYKNRIFSLRPRPFSTPPIIGKKLFAPQAPLLPNTNGMVSEIGYHDLRLRPRHVVVIRRQRTVPRPEPAQTKGPGRTACAPGLRPSRLPSTYDSEVRVSFFFSSSSSDAANDSRDTTVPDRRGGRRHYLPDSALVNADWSGGANIRPWEIPAARGPSPSAKKASRQRVSRGS